jgi:hypothetical protein
MEMPAARAVLSGLVDRALQCDFRALKQVFDLVKDTGHDQDVTDEERAKRTFKLIRAFTRDQYDLKVSEARKREYCNYAVLADYHLGFKVSEPPAKGDTFFVLLKAADRERIKGRLSDALIAYSKMLESLETSSIKGQASEATHADRRQRLITRIALLASDFVFAHEPQQALRAADLADTPDTPANWLPLIRAHAKLMLGDIGAARSYYFSHASFWRHAYTSWERVIMLDFRALRAAGYNHPLMGEAEKRYTDAGWSVDRYGGEVPAAVTAARFDGSPPASLRSRRHAPQQPPAESQKPVVRQPNEAEALESAAAASDITSGDKLFAAGRLEDALTVYKRRVEECKHRLEAGQRLPGIVDDRTKAFGAIRGVAIALLAFEQISEAQSTADYLLQTEGDTVLNRILRAHVCMLSGREGEARAIYYETGPMRANAEHDGRHVILDDFQVLSTHGIPHALIKEVEEMLSRPRLIK